jgi:hypothetical protein
MSVTNLFNVARTWTDSSSKRPKLRNIYLTFGT